MSISRAAVLFPDGTIKYTTYQNTSDVLRPTLHDTLDAAWNHTESWASLRESADDPEEDVKIFVDYGGGFWWYGQANRKAVTSTLLIGCAEFDIFDGEPEWVRWR